MSNLGAKLQKIVHVLCSIIVAECLYEIQRDEIKQQVMAVLDKVIQSAIAANNTCDRRRPKVVSLATLLDGIVPFKTEERVRDYISSLSVPQTPDILAGNASAHSKSLDSLPTVVNFPDRTETASHPRSIDRSLAPSQSIPRYGKTIPETHVTQSHSTPTLSSAAMQTPVLIPTNEHSKGAQALIPALHSKELKDSVN
jgi:hypothetical protein